MNYVHTTHTLCTRIIIIIIIIISPLYFFCCPPPPPHSRIIAHTIALYYTIDRLYDCMDIIYYCAIYIYGLTPTFLHLALTLTLTDC